VLVYGQPYICDFSVIFLGTSFAEPMVLPLKCGRTTILRVHVTTHEEHS
jgi:hypothetical protein